MLETHTSSVASGLRSNNTTRLALRIYHKNGHEDVVYVGGTKCTIGSGPRCTLRLRQDGVGPLHCLIVSGNNDVSARRWSAETWLNGQEFSEASLCDGDRLTIGPVEIDVLLGPPAADERLNELSGNESDQHQSQPSPSAEASDSLTNDDTSVIDDADATRSGIHDAEFDGSCDDDNETERLIRRSASLVPHDTDDEQKRLPDSKLDPATEEVFRQLKAANEANRSRARRLLGALKQKRESSRQLEARIDYLQQQLDKLVQEIDVNQGTAEPLPVTVGEIDAPDTSTATHGDAPNYELAPELAPELEDTTSTKTNGAGDERDLLESGYAAQLEARKDGIADLEKQLGYYDEPGDPDHDETLEPPSEVQVDAPIADVQPIAARIPAPSPMEESGDSSRVDPGRLPEHASGEAAQATSDDDTSLTDRQDHDLFARFKQSGNSDPSSNDDLTGRDAVRAVEGSEVSSDAASFWGFDADAASVDQELLGPKPLPHRAEAVSDSPRDESVTGERTRDVEALPSAGANVSRESALEEADPASDRLSAAGDFGQLPTLPPSEPPPIPGLTDSALAHLRELAIWQERDNGTGSGPVDELADEIEIAAEPPESLADDFIQKSASYEIQNDGDESWPSPAETGQASGIRQSPLEVDGLLSPEDEHIAESVEVLGEREVFSNGEPSAESMSSDLVPEGWGKAESGSSESVSAAQAGDIQESTKPAKPTADALSTSATNAQLTSPSSPVGPFSAKRIEKEENANESAVPGTTSFIERYAEMFAEDDGEKANADNDSSAVFAAESAQPIERVATSPRPQDVAENAAASDAVADGDDESLDDYMARLMQRVRGESSTGLMASTPPPVATERILPKHNVTSPATQTVPNTMGHTGSTPAPLESSADELPVEPLTLESIKSGPAPEYNADMNALRELANQTARSAIGVHDVRKRKKSLTGRLVCAGIATVSGVYLLVTAPDLISIQFLVGSVGALVAAYIVGNTTDSLLNVNQVEETDASTGEVPDEAPSAEDASPDSTEPLSAIAETSSV